MSAMRTAIGNHLQSQNASQLSATLGGLQRGTTLEQAATFGAPARAALTTGIVADGTAVAAGAMAWGYWEMGGVWRAILGNLRGLHDEALPPPKPPELPTGYPPHIAQPASLRLWNLSLALLGLRR